jgi:hypothetical protein
MMPKAANSATIISGGIVSRPMVELICINSIQLPCLMIKIKAPYYHRFPIS